MTLAAFSNLNEDDRFILWHTNSVQIAERETVENFFALFQLDSFYVEMKFFKLSDREPEMYAFSDDMYLRPYLYMININEVFS